MANEKTEKTENTEKTEKIVYGDPLGTDPQALADGGKPEFKTLGDKDAKVDKE